MVEDCSRQAFRTWLADRDEAWRNQVEVVAIDQRMIAAYREEDRGRGRELMVDLISPDRG